MMAARSRSAAGRRSDCRKSRNELEDSREKTTREGIRQACVFRPSIPGSDFAMLSRRSKTI
jgi:hypothetical protein